LLLVADDGEGGNGGHHAIVWEDPVLTGAAGELSLRDLPWVRATSRWGSVMRDRGPGGRALLLAGREVGRGFGVHTKSLIEFVVPAGYTRLSGACGFEGPTPPTGSAERARCLVFVEPPEPDAPSPGLPMAVTAAELGLEGPIQVRDLWSGEDYGRFDASIEATVPWHGARLFRVAGRAPK
jgi:hypothetical protein